VGVLHGLEQFDLGSYNTLNVTVNTSEGKSPPGFASHGRNLAHPNSHTQSAGTNQLGATGAVEGTQRPKPQ